MPVVIDYARLIRFLFAIGVFLTPLGLGAEIDGSGTGGDSRRDESWLIEADHAMTELMALDAALHSLTSRIESPDSRNVLIRTRNDIRRLIYDLVEKRNEVVRRMEGRADGQGTLVDAHSQ